MTGYRLLLAEKEKEIIIASHKVSACNLMWRVFLRPWARYSRGSLLLQVKEIKCLNREIRAGAQ